MGKRCIDIECPFLAQDGSCLLAPKCLADECPAREKKDKEYKDEWMERLEGP